MGTAHACPFAFSLLRIYGSRTSAYPACDAERYQCSDSFDTAGAYISSVQAQIFKRIGRRKWEHVGREGFVSLVREQSAFIEQSVRFLPF